MKRYYSKIVGLGLAGVFLLFGILMGNAGSAMAAGYSLTMAPMYQDLVINPGESQRKSFSISNAADSTQDTYYKIEVEPFTINNGVEVEYVAEGDSGEMVKWITFDVPTEGKLAPNEVKEIVFTINVPSSAPAGGQYAAISITASARPEGDKKELEKNTTIIETKRMSHLVYAEIAGETDKTGEFLESNVPSFLLSGSITGSARVKNTGNVHSKAKYTLQIFPLFSSEEIYTNEEKPTSFTVMPGKELYSEIHWNDTPSIGIFNVVFKGEFGGKTLEVSKMVIICPLWLLFIIVFAIVVLIIWIFMKAKNRKKESKRSEEE